MAHIDAYNKKQHVRILYISGSLYIVYVDKSPIVATHFGVIVAGTRAVDVLADILSLETAGGQQFATKTISVKIAAT